MLLALLPALLVIAQPDLGTGLVYVTVAFATLFFAGTSWRQLTALLALFVVAVTLVLAVAPALGVHVLKPYQVQRLTGFLNPSKNPQGATYNIGQSLIAIGSGGKTGLGVHGATQTSLGYLPEHQTDFIFAVVGETYGFAGAALVLSLYALLIWRTLRIVTMSKNLYGTLIAGGILAMLMFQVFVNVGMTIGIMPITGVPLPLMSYGGSSVIVTFLALGTAGVDSHPGTADICRQGPRGARMSSRPSIHLAVRRPAHPPGSTADTLKGLNRIEEASTRQRRPRRDPRGAAGGDGHRRRAQARLGHSRRRRRTKNPAAGYYGRRALPRAPRQPLDRRQHLQGARRQRARRAGGGVRRHRPGEERLPARRRDRAAGRRGARGAAAAAARTAARSPICSSPARRSSSRWSRTR